MALTPEEYGALGEQQLNKTIKQLPTSTEQFYRSIDFPTQAMTSSPSTINFSFLVPEVVAGQTETKSDNFKRLLGSGTKPYTPETKQQSATIDNTVRAIEGIGKTATGTIGKVNEKINDLFGSNLQTTFDTKIQSLVITGQNVNLYQPHQLEFLSGAEWHPIDADPSFIGLLSMSVGAGMQSDEGFWNGLATAFGFAAGAVTREMLIGMASQLVEGQSKGIGEALSKSIENPFTDMAFKTMARRTFRMSWQFYPKNASEAARLKEVINIFRFHMHPSLNESLNGAYLNFPSYIRPTFLFNGKENPFLPRISLSVINAVNVDMSPNQQWVTHKDGTPTQVNFSLEFSEVQPLLKEDIAGGF